MIGIDDAAFLVVGSAVAAGMSRLLERRRPSGGVDARLDAANTQRAVARAEAQMQQITRQAIDQMLAAPHQHYIETTARSEQ